MRVDLLSLGLQNTITSYLHMGMFNGITELLKHEPTTILLYQFLGVVPYIFNCEACHSQMLISFTSQGWRAVCDTKECGNSVSIYKNTWFARRQVGQLAKFIYGWSFGMKLYAIADSSQIPYTRINVYVKDVAEIINLWQQKHPIIFDEEMAKRCGEALVVELDGVFLGSNSQRATNCNTKKGQKTHRLSKQ